MPIYFLTFHTKPGLNHEEVNNIDGAYINCWVEADDINAAEKIARLHIENTNWNILKLDDGYEITREDYTSRNKGLECYEQALIDKEVYYIQTYSSNDDE